MPYSELDMPLSTTFFKTMSGFAPVTQLFLTAMGFRGLPWDSYFLELPMASRGHRTSNIWQPGRTWSSTKSWLPESLGFGSGPLVPTYIRRPRPRYRRGRRQGSAILGKYQKSVIRFRELAGSITSGVNTNDMCKQSVKIVSRRRRAQGRVSK